jgi:hypothetical protein
MHWARRTTVPIILLLVLGCDRTPTSSTSGIPEVSRQAISKQQVVRFTEEINKRNASNPALNPQIETHFQLVRQVLSDDAILSVFENPKLIKRRLLLEYQDTVKVNGMLQTNCSYELNDCEVVIHLTLLPCNDADLAKHMRGSWINKDVVRSEKRGKKDVFISKSERHMGGTVFGERLLVSFFARNPGAASGNEFAMNEERLWTVLQSVASRVE